MNNYALGSLTFSILLYTISQAKRWDMKNINQRKYEALKRQQEIARKNRKLGLTESGNVPTSFAQNTKEKLLTIGFYLKGEKTTPTKDSLSEKKLDSDIVDIEIRKRN